MYEKRISDRGFTTIRWRPLFALGRLGGATLVLILLAGATLGLSTRGWTQDNQTSASDSICTSKQLAARSQALDRREQAMNSAEAQLNARLAQLKQLEGKLTTMLNEANSIKDARMVHLIDVYTNMKPRQAGAVLATLDEPTAVKVLAGMKGRQAGNILTFVPPKKAASLSVALTRLQMNPPLPKKP